MSDTAVEVQSLAYSTNYPTPSTIDHVPPESPTSRKRSRDEEKTTVLTLKDIHIRPFPGLIYDKPLLLRPLRHVPRSRLPLTFLDISNTTSQLSPSRLFSADIEILEQEENNSSEAFVLIACLESSKTLYAIERVKPRVYTLCQLCHWVKISYIEEGPVSMFQHSEHRNPGQRWWSSCIVDTERTEHRQTKKRIKLSMMAPPISEDHRVDPIVTALSVPELAAEATDPSILPALDTTVTAAVEERKTEEVFEGLIRQYLEALYISKTSLAFFVKGPLSRARNNFMTNTDAGVMAAFITQLRAMLLSMVQMDKKYREKLPEIIKSFPAQSLSDDEMNAPVTVKKRRSKKVPKISRDGYYPIEADYSKRWWLDNQSAASRARQDETFEQLVRRRVGDLRRRETLAQIVLILELLALEALPEAKAAKADANESRVEQACLVMTSQLQDLEGSEPAAVTKKPKIKAKKEQDLDLLLDLLLDKLSIWQSIEQDLGNGINVDKKRDSRAENNEKLHEQDMLVGFCTDVVIPFYKSRVPTQASLVNKKLGGPGAVSPAKAEKPKSRDAGKAIHKPGDKRSRRPLQKTLSDVNGFIRSRPPSLSRSLTDIQGLPRIKREASELSLLDVPLARPSHRDSMSQLRHLQQRTVDMTAISTATDVKLKQKAKIEQDLKEAINTLKRPNRGQAVRELADAADQRSLGSASMRKKTMGPIRKVLQTVRNVQVTATPKHRRAIKTLAPPQALHEDDFEEQHAPSSGDFCIPSSGYRAANADVVGATPAVSRLKPLNGLFATSVTPSKRPMKDSTADEVEPDEIGATPARKPNAQSQTPVGSLSKPANSSFQDFMLSQMSRKPVTSTPMKRTSKNTSLISEPLQTPAIFATPAKRKVAVLLTPQQADDKPQAVVSQQEEMQEQSIYEALGWNDYDDD